VVHRYGSAGLGLDVTSEAWLNMVQVFCSEDCDPNTDTPNRPSLNHQQPVQRLKHDFLVTYPVDLLVLGDLSLAQSQEWRLQISNTTASPKIVYEFWPEHQLAQADGPMSKQAVTGWEELGYQSNCCIVNATQVGGVVNRPWLIVVRYHENFLRTRWLWLPITEEIRRPMDNCLRPTGIPFAAYRTDLQTAKARLAHPSSIPDSEKDPMPAYTGQLITTPRGTRRLRNDELARGQGVPKSWMGERYPRSKLVNRTVPVHILEYVGSMLTEPVPADEPEEDPPVMIPRCFTLDFDPVKPFHWHPPDVSENSEWTKQRAHNLVTASLHFKDPAKIIEDGMLMLRKHRDNYDDTGPTPTHMQLLWWEFPEESWDELREGCSMNFVLAPPTKITPNSELDPEQIAMAEEFVNELVSLGVLVQVKPGEMLANGPLFCLPKPGQPSQ
jgi:hypothetical protein